jgi:hypothetical protein
MAHGTIQRLPWKNGIGSFIEYKIQPSDLNKSLKQLAREQLMDESLYDQILLKVAEPATNPKWYTTINDKSKYDPNWTLLLPPSEFAAFIVTVNTNIRKTPEEVNGNILEVAKQFEKYFYKRSTVKVNGQMVWAEVSKTNPARFGNIPYWICVKNKTYNTNPPIDFPS